MLKRNFALHSMSHVYQVVSGIIICIEEETCREDESWRLPKAKCLSVRFPGHFMDIKDNLELNMKDGARSVRLA